MALAIFDLDNTLLNGDSDYLWGVFLAEQGLVDGSLYERENERFYQEYKDGRLDIFSLPDVDYGTPPDWNRDPRTGVRAPLEFGKTLNYRDEAKVGDIKYLWEPNRHLQLVWLCQAFHLSGDAKYLDAFRAQLDSWFEQCPYLRGPNWTSSLELGIRLINWSICWQLVGERQSPLFDGAAGGRHFDQLQGMGRHTDDAVHFMHPLRSFHHRSGRHR